MHGKAPHFKAFYNATIQHTSSSALRSQHHVAINLLPLGQLVHIIRIWRDVSICHPYFKLSLRVNSPFPLSLMKARTSATLFSTSFNNSSFLLLTSSFRSAAALTALATTSNLLTQFTSIMSNGVVVLPSSLYPSTVILSKPGRPNNSPPSSV